MRRLLTAIFAIITSGSLSHAQSQNGENAAARAHLIEAAYPAVVQVGTVSAPAEIREPLDIVRRLSKPQVGTGFVIDKERALVLTMAYLIEDTEDITMTLADGSSVTARVVATDHDLGVSVLKGPGPLQDALLLSAEGARRGEAAYAIGQAYEIGIIATEGMVSGLSRSLPDSELLGTGAMLMLDLVVHRGMSGGPILNDRGEVMGIATAIYTPTGSALGSIGIALDTLANREQLDALLKQAQSVE